MSTQTSSSGNNREMGSELLPLLKNHSFLISTGKKAFKIKALYDRVPEGVGMDVSREEAHSEIEDVIRAMLYQIEREKGLKIVQTDHFIIRPTCVPWSLGHRVWFRLDGKSLSTHKFMIVLRISLKEKPAPPISLPSKNVDNRRFKCTPLCCVPSKYIDNRRFKCTPINDTVNKGIILREPCRLNIHKTVHQNGHRDL